MAERRDGEHTKDFLARELMNAGLSEMSMAAAQGYYHDFLSPLDMPCQQLEIDLLAHARRGNREAEALRRRHLRGEFDADKLESEAWAASPEGRDAFRSLVTGAKMRR